MLRNMGKLHDNAGVLPFEFGLLIWENLQYKLVFVQSSACRLWKSLHLKLTVQL